MTRPSIDTSRSTRRLDAGEACDALGDWLGLLRPRAKPAAAVSVAIEDWSGVAASVELFELLDRISAGPPYNYLLDETPPASDWFERLLGAAGARACVAVAETGAPVGFCVSLPLTAHADARDAAQPAVSDPGQALYLAELGVDERYRRRGVADRLLGCATAAAVDREIVVRTLVDNAPAIRFYERHGFHTVDRVRQTHDGRDRLFLLRPRPRL